MSQRIIGGALRGKRLLPIRGVSIRPTGDRQRESIFNLLAGQIEGTTVLDLFAGTGALGIEALSRGARMVVFVDNDKTALSILEQNTRSCRIENRVKIIRWNISMNLGCLSALGLNYSLVFMDPPYNKGYIEPTLAHLRKARCLADGAIGVVEHSPEENVPEKGSGYERYDQRRYGKTLVSLLNFVI